MHARLMTALLAGAGLTLSATAPLAADDAAKVEVSQKEAYGKYLSDADGKSLYLFEADTENDSTCYDACAAAWPPLTTEGEPTAGQGADKSMLSTIERKDGSMQVTYNGWPLYYFVKDQQAGDIKGQDIEGFGAEWYLVSPAGEKVHGEGEQS
jgi:predicted lipoprotein with Yx(FWY)xxD motif